MFVISMFRESAMEDEKTLALKYFNEAYAHQRHGRLEAAVVLYRQSIEIHPTAEAYTFLGWTFSMMKRYDDAIAECRKAIEIDSEYGNPYNDIGAYLIDQGKIDEAILWLEKAVHASRYESYCYPHYNLGRIWEQKGELAKALREYELALEECPNYGLARQAIAKIRAMMN